MATSPCQKENWNCSSLSAIFKAIDGMILTCRPWPWFLSMSARPQICIHLGQETTVISTQMGIIVKGKRVKMRLQAPQFWPAMVQQMQHWNCLMTSVWWPLVYHPMLINTKPSWYFLQNLLSIWSLGPGVRSWMVSKKVSRPVEKTFSWGSKQVQWFKKRIFFC